ncbi:MAG: NAD-dependent epimerase/dehydratase family protein [Synechococcaceae bacterium WB8_1B_057]|nr:NAD-dependent epimerase/dehydratase family protein [Synechococcaceae bacterium WB6_1A_059]NDG79600.1 NAD-dependent epimerase/dehydratase family protein [Synechococcaceae bacterium WB8_1B_057]
MKQALITGANGFLGHVLVEEFLKDYEITALVRPGTKNLSRLDHLKDRIKIIFHDITKPLDHLLSELKNIKLILHAAGNPSSDESLKDPVKVVHDNIIGTINLLNIARNLDIERFFYYSAGETLGPVSLEKESAETDPYNCVSIYSASKVGGSEMCTAFHHTFGIPISITHVTNTFGQRSQVNRFPIMVIKKLLRNEELKIHIGDDNLISGRRWFHCEDVALQTRLILEKQKTGCEKWNSSGSTFLTNLEFATLIADSLNLKLKFDLITTSKKGNEPFFIPSPSKLVSHGWIEPLNISQRIKQTVEWYNQNPQWLSI